MNTLRTVNTNLENRLQRVVTLLQSIQNNEMPISQFNNIVEENYTNANVFVKSALIY